MRLVQLWNALVPNVVIVSGRVTVVRLVQSRNALLLISITPDEISIDRRPLQFWNALLPNVVIVSGRVTVVRPVQFNNALSEIILNTEPGIPETEFRASKSKSNVAVTGPGVDSP